MIIVKNRQLLFSNNEDYIGTTYDRDSTNRVFRLDRINEDGVDLAKLDFNIDLVYMKDLTSDTDVLEKTVDDRYVYLTWLISEVTASKAGTIKINLRGKDISGLIKWASFQDLVYVSDSGQPITPSEEELSELEHVEAMLAQLRTDLNLSEAQRQENEAVRQENEAERVEAEKTRQEQFENTMDEFNEDKEDLHGYAVSAGESAAAAAGSASAAAGSASDAEEAKNAAEIARDQAEGAAVARIDDKTIKRNDDGEMYAEIIVMVGQGESVPVSERTEGKVYYIETDSSGSDVPSGNIQVSPNMGLEIMQ